MILKEFVDQIFKELQKGLNDNAIGQIEPTVRLIIEAKRIACYGVGREGLMMKTVAMRLYHLGLDAHVVGDMTTPPLGSGDLLFVSAGPGFFSTVESLVITARQAGSKLLCITATPSGRTPALCDQIIFLPAQTMAIDQNASIKSVLPMGSLYEGIMFIYFELLVLALKEKLELSSEVMRNRHTNLE